MHQYGVGGKRHHYLQSEVEAFHMAYQAWGETRPVFHYSNSRRENEDPTTKREAHADYIYEPINTYGKEVDIVLEAKMKEKAVLKYVEQFGGLK